MALAPLPDDEAGRLAAVRRYEILDTERERSFDDLVALAAQLCRAPIALLSLIDDDRQWFKARIGVEVDESPRALAFCAYTILSDEILEIGDAQEDPRVADHPLVRGGPKLRFYAGAPLVTGDGFRIGALCVLDRTPRRLDAEQRAALEALARQAVALLELRHGDRTLARLLRGAHAARVSPEDAPRGGEAASEQALLHCVARDLRAPLTAILGVGEALIDDVASGIDPRPSLAALRVLTAAAEHMLHLGGDVVDLVRVESGRLHLHPVPCAPTAVAEEIAAAMEPLARAGGNRIAIVDQGVGSIVADPTRLRQILFHLVSNACEATRDGEIAVELGREDDEWARIAVRDTGVGIAEHVRRRLFRPALPVDDGVAGSGGGLGLVLTRGLCERMGGAIAVESAPGEGATFTVWLPIRPRRLVDDAPAVLVVAPEPGGRAWVLRALAGVARVVVVDAIAEARALLGGPRFSALVIDDAVGRPGAAELDRIRRSSDESLTIAWIAGASRDLGRGGDPSCVVLGRHDLGELRRFVDGLAP